MTVEEFITRFDADHENQMTQAQKIRWLKRIELLVMSEIMHQHWDYDKSGMHKGTIMYPGDDLESRLTDDKGMDISDLPDMYVDGDTLVLTAYDPGRGSSEAEEMDAKTMLQIPEPYDNVYEYYLVTRIAELTGNVQEYNRASARFNEAYRAFHKYWNRTHVRNMERPHLMRHEVL